jgi:hypothetical protein
MHCYGCFQFSFYAYRKKKGIKKLQEALTLWLKEREVN